MRTHEPMAIGLRVSTSIPDELMLSTRARVALSSPCARRTGQQMGMRSDTLPARVPIGIVAPASSICRLVQERLIQIPIVAGSRSPFNRAKPRRIRLTMPVERKAAELGTDGRKVSLPE